VSATVKQRDEFPTRVIAPKVDEEEEELEKAHRWPTEAELQGQIETALLASPCEEHLDLDAYIAMLSN
jgi:hypothetical protein